MSGGNYRRNYNNGYGPSRNYGYRPYRNQNQITQGGRSASDVTALIADAINEIEKKKEADKEKQEMKDFMKEMQQTISGAMKRHASGPPEPTEPKPSQKKPKTSSSKECGRKDNASDTDDLENDGPDLIANWEAEEATAAMVQQAAKLVLPLSLLISLKNCDSDQEVSDLVKEKYKAGGKYRKSSLLTVQRTANSKEKGLKKLYEFINSVSVQYWKMVPQYERSPEIPFPFPTPLSKAERISLEITVNSLAKTLATEQPLSWPRSGLQDWTRNYCQFCMVKNLLYSAQPQHSHLQAIFAQIVPSSSRQSWTANESWYIPNTIYLCYNYKTGSFYIGETKLTLFRRICAHLTSLQTPFAREVWKTPCDFIWIPILHCTLVIGRGKSETEKLTFRKRTEYLLIRSLTPNLNGNTFSFQKTPFKAVAQRAILSRISGQTPAFLKSWRILTYIIKVDGGKPFESFSLEKVLQTLPSGSIVSISHGQPGHDITDFKKLSTSFKGSVSLDFGRRLSPPFLNSRLAQIPTTFLLNNPSAVSVQTLSTGKPSLEELAVTLFAAQGVRNFTLIKTATYLLGKNYGVRIFKAYTLRIPENLRATNAQVLAMAKAILDEANMPSSLKTILCNRLKVIRSNNRTVGEILFNYRQHDTKWTKGTRTCICGNPVEHSRYLMVNAKSHIIRNVGKMGANFVPPTGERTISSRLRTACKEFLDALVNTSPLILQTLMKGKVMLTKADDMVSDILALGTRRPVPNECQLELVRGTKQLLKGWIISPTDKNLKVMLVECPAGREEAIIKSYLNAKHYKVFTHATSKAYTAHINMVTDKFQRFCHSDAITKIGMPRRSNTLPYNYVLAKYKDISRYRPVTSYFKHLLKNIFRKTGGCITFLLNRWQGHHFNLDQIKDVKNFLDSIGKWKRTMTKLGYTVYASQYDVKEMFTNIPQKEIITALTTVIGDSPGDGVWIPHDGNPSLASFTKTAAASLYISYRAIINIVKFDVDNAYSTLGGRIVLKQEVGIPIGGVMSASLARLVVSTMEHKILQAQPILQLLIKGGRYTDDSRIYAASYSKKGGEILIEDFMKATYTGGLTVEEDIQPEDYFVWVGIRGNESGYRPNNKNHNQVLLAEEQKFKRFQHATSDVPKAQKCASCIGALISIADYSSDASQIRMAVACVVAEFWGLGYSRQFFLNCISKAKSSREILHTVIPDTEQVIDDIIFSLDQTHGRTQMTSCDEAAIT